MRTQPLHQLSAEVFFPATTHLFVFPHCCCSGWFTQLLRRNGMSRACSSCGSSCGFWIVYALLESSRPPLPSMSERVVPSPPAVTLATTVLRLWIGVPHRCGDDSCTVHVSERDSEEPRRPGVAGVRVPSWLSLSFRCWIRIFSARAARLSLQLRMLQLDREISMRSYHRYQLTAA